MFSRNKRLFLKILILRQLNRFVKQFIFETSAALYTLEGFWKLIFKLEWARTSAICMKLLLDLIQWQITTVMSYSSVEAL